MLSSCARGGRTDACPPAVVDMLAVNGSLLVKLKLASRQTRSRPGGPALNEMTSTCPAKHSPIVVVGVVVGDVVCVVVGDVVGVVVMQPGESFAMLKSTFAMNELYPLGNGFVKLFPVNTFGEYRGECLKFGVSDTGMYISGNPVKNLKRSPVSICVTSLAI